MQKILEDLPSLNWLKTFVSAATSLNFTVAANELNMSQSAVSQQIKLLEGHLGQPLFHRHHKKLSLTNSGVAYLSRVQPALEGIRRATRDLFSPLEYGDLSLQVNTAFLLMWLSPRMAEFTRLYPDVNLRLLSINWDADRLEMSNDLVIDYGKGRWPNMASHRLLAPRLQPYCSPELAEKLHNGSDLQDFPLIEVMGVQQQWKSWLKATGIEREAGPTRHQVDTIATAAELAKRGVGLFLSYEELLAEDIREGRLIAPFKQSIEVEDSYYLAHSNNAPLSKSAELFKNWLLENLN